MSEKPVDLIKRLLGLGPILLFMLLVFEAGAYLLHRANPIPLYLSRTVQIALTVPLVLIFLVGYISFVTTFLKRNMGTAVLHDGPFAFVRHPLYATDLFTLPALLAVWFNDLYFIFAWAILILILAFAVRIEEKYMEAKFGQEYVEYKKKVPALVPWKGRVKF